jgi:hypothetical protein
MAIILETTSEKAVILFLAAFVVFSIVITLGGWRFIPVHIGIVVFLGLLIGLWISFHVWGQRNIPFSSRVTFRKTVQI